MQSALRFLQRKFRKQFHKYWQRSLPWRERLWHRRFPLFAAEYVVFRAQARRRNPRFDLSWRDRIPCLDDNTRITPYQPSYLHPLAWAARGIAQNEPQLHTDVGSGIEFCAMISSFTQVERYAREPIEIDLATLATRQGDLSKLPIQSGSVTSLSCLAVVEHQGLGRFGEALNPDADLEVMGELQRVLAPGGSLFLSVPVGRPRIAFNSHRIYGAGQIQAIFSGFELHSFALVEDKGTFVENAEPAQADSQENGVGCWWYRKPPHRPS